MQREASAICRGALESPIGWQAVAKVIDVAPGGGAFVTSERELVVAGQVVDHAVLPGISVGKDGAVAYAKSTNPPASDVWRFVHGETTRITTDQRSDRPLLLPDGRLLWVSGAGGVAGFVLDGRRLTNAGRYQVPVPARPAATRAVDGGVEYDAGDGRWWLDLETGEAAPR